MEPRTQSQPPSLGADDRRRNKRTDVVVDARLECAGITLDGRIENLSFGGAYFVTTRRGPDFSMGAEAVLTLVPLPNTAAGELCWDCTVVRCESPRAEDPSRVAYGLQFEQPVPSSRSRMDDTQSMTGEI